MALKFKFQTDILLHDKETLDIIILKYHLCNGYGYPREARNDTMAHPFTVTEIGSRIPMLLPHSFNLIVILTLWAWAPNHINFDLNYPVFRINYNSNGFSLVTNHNQYLKVQPTHISMTFYWTSIIVSHRNLCKSNRFSHFNSQSNQAGCLK